MNAVLFAQFATILYKRIASLEETRKFLAEVEKVVRAAPAATCLVRSALLQLMLTDRDAQKRVKNIDQIRVRIGSSCSIAHLYCHFTDGTRQTRTRSRSAARRHRSACAVLFGRLYFWSLRRVTTPVGVVELLPRGGRVFELLCGDSALFGLHGT